MDFFDIKGTVDFVLCHDYKRIALQFPDDLLSHAPRIASTLKSHVASSTSDRNVDEISFFILADTSYGSCCVDEVAAQHASADLVIHYGPACLSRTLHLPVLYVFGKKVWSVQRAHSAFLRQFPPVDEGHEDRSVVILAERCYEHALSDLLHLCRKTHRHVYMASSAWTFYSPSTSEAPSSTMSGRVWPPEVLNTGEVEEQSSVSSSVPLKTDTVIFYIGSECAAWTSLMMSWQGCTFVRYDPHQGAETSVAEGIQSLSLISEVTDGTAEPQTTVEPKLNKQLMKRYLLVEKARDAQVIAILVGTLGIASTLETIQTLRQLILRADKKPFVISVGKLNPSKLANFMEVDIFVWVACPEAALVDGKDFLQPILTPFELRMALDPTSHWNPLHHYPLDFQLMMNKTSSDRTIETEEDRPRFSLATGQYTRRVIPIAIETTEENEGSLTRAVFGELVSGQYQETLMRGRTWRGLELEDQIEKEDQGEKEDQINCPLEPQVKQGRRGNASGYDNEFQLK